jgi:hypothetical protein
MTTPAQPIDISAFKGSITPDLYRPDHYIDWKEIEKDLAKFETAINYLQSAVDKAPLGSEALVAGLKCAPRLYEVISLLLALPQTAVGFTDGRELPDPARPLSPELAPDIASLLLTLGIANLVQPGVNVRPLARTALAGLDAGKRRYRVAAAINEQLKVVLDHAIAAASREHGVTVEKVPPAQWPQALKGRVECILAIGSRQNIAVTTIFQTASGGRQQSELSTTFPNLQRELAEYGLNLILVADGRGVRDARDPVLQTMFAGVASCMTFRQAESGRLLQEILRLVKTEPPSQEHRALKSIIHATISAGGSITAAQLPGDIKRASLSIAAYANENPEMDLVLDSSGSGVSWGRKDLVLQALRLKSAFSPEAALVFFGKILQSVSTTTHQQQDDITFAIEDVEDGDGILPKKLLVAAVMTTPGPEIAKRIALLTLTKAPDSKTSILLAPRIADGEPAALLRRLQSTLTSNVIVIDSNLLLRMAQTKELPRNILAQQLLEQSDLVKTSPFILTSVTPNRIFYGREAEEANMVATLGSNSIALLGGRCIGKTSLMRHVEARLNAGGFQTFFGDCQTVKNWDGFAEMAERLWSVTLARPFRPGHLFDLIKQLKKTPDAKMVFLLDEIDQLLGWDKQQTDDQVPEAFFRACRTASQESQAQFVFSGERTISGRLWDAQSPHWNFCRQLMLRQLEPVAAGQLIIKPLRAMQITVQDERSFAATAWLRTSGHPQLLQTLGDDLVRLLNERDPASRAMVSAQDLVAVADVWSYVEHYLETYWGQATDLERALTLLVATGCERVEGCREFLLQRGVELSDADVRSGLRMLELYGVTDASETGYRIRPEWFRTAVAFYGPIEKLLEQYAAKLK